MRTSLQLTSLDPMTRCECQEVEFKDVVNCARVEGIWDFDTLREKVGCGQICTACHCDLKKALNKAAGSKRISAEPRRFAVR